MNPALSTNTHKASVAAASQPSDLDSNLETAPVQASSSGATADSRNQAIREAAFALYEARGCIDGHALDDWLQAEEAVHCQMLEAQGA